MPGLFREDALAFNDSYAEFQQGHVTVRVDFPEHGTPAAWLARASVAFDAIWADVPKMIGFARAYLRTLDPPRWQAYAAAGVGEQVLIAYDIWIEPVDGLSSCQVVADEQLTLPPGLPGFTDADDVVVMRSPSGWLLIDGVMPEGSVLMPLPRHIAPPSPRRLLRCPCCRCKTLRRRSIYAICPVCFWEDDGQDDDDADVVFGGPNGDLSLTQGQANYREFGASRRQDLPHVRRPLDHELPD